MRRRLNPSAISIGTMLQPLLLTTSALSISFKVVVAQDALGESTDVLKEHRLPLAVGADDECGGSSATAPRSG